jgi:hypothetical protein
VGFSPEHRRAAAVAAPSRALSLSSILALKFSSSPRRSSKGPFLLAISRVFPSPADSSFSQARLAILSPSVIKQFLASLENQTPTKGPNGDADQKNRIQPLGPIALETLKQLLEVV